MLTVCPACSPHVPYAYCVSVQVIHSDLKVRNVLMKSDGSSERGCIAKVADFGLAVKMDHQDTHVSAFQVKTKFSKLYGDGHAEKFQRMHAPHSGKRRISCAARRLYYGPASGHAWCSNRRWSCSAMGVCRLQMASLLFALLLY